MRKSTESQYFRVSSLKRVEVKVEGFLYEEQLLAGGFVVLVISYF